MMSQRGAVKHMKSCFDMTSQTFLYFFFLHVLESSDPRFLLLIQFLHFLLSAQKEFAAAADCEGKQEFS